MNLVFFFAFIGLWIGRLPGMVMGAALAFAITRLLPSLLRRGLQAVHSRFLDSTFAVVGAICKADGVVTPDEIQFVEGLFIRLHLSETQKNEAKASFKRGKAPDFDLDAEVEGFAQAARGNHALLQMFLRVQLMAIAADGKIHAAEHEMLVRVARRLGLRESELAQLEALLRATASGSASSAWPGPAAGPTPKDRLEDAYSALGLSSDASEAQLKSAYRKLMRENHPDRLAAKGLSENLRELAEERAREINVAYDLLKKARGFN